ncbi:glycosyltransferase family 2 protein [Segetibacter koreensis]|uniref:glycosyltransferase family 2 protein n=1 Tax=Segetibacter koreensis TaxID=398037 RepID=UPI0003625104|nr:glycosyltransferase family 2 protein [Segetibacter koreensis]
MNKVAPSVGIGILNWNGKKFLEALLPQLNNLTYPNYNIYVIDNTSSDDSIAYISKYHPNVKVIALDKNYGFAAGYNRGFAHMPEEYYLMLNSDVEVPAGFIKPLVEMMEEDINIAICQPKLLSLTNPQMLEHGGAAGGMIDFLGYPFCRGRIFDTSEPDNQQYSTSADIFWASGACCLVRKDAYWKINGMYEFFFMHSEEIDMCWRLITTGYKIQYCPTSYIYHLGGGSLAYQSPRKTYLNFRNNIIMCFRNSPWYVLTWLLPVRIVLDTIASFKFLAEGDKSNCKAVFRAYLDFMKWLVNEKNKFPANKKSLLSIPTVLKKSIVWEYYIKKNKYYSKIKR